MHIQRARISILVVVLATVISYAGGVQAQVPMPTGWWEFTNPSDLGSATIGEDLVASGGGFTAIEGVASGDGAVTVGVGSYYVMTHGIAANGGGIRVNNWSLLIDFRVPSVGQWYCFFQTNPANSDDGEYFISDSDDDIGVGALGYSADGDQSGFTVEPGVWYRMVVSIEGEGNVYHTYINGAQIATRTVGELDSRFSLDTTLLMFADENSEDNPIDVSNVAIWDEPLSAWDAGALASAGSEVLIPDNGSVVSDTASWVEVGQDVTLSVAHVEVVGTASYAWKKYGGSFARDPGNTHTLVMNSVTEDDTGSYAVEITDGSKGTFQTDPFMLHVFAAGSLPTAGVWGLGLLAGACAAGGAYVLAKRRR